MAGMLPEIWLSGHGVSAFIASGINFDRNQEFSAGYAMNDLRSHVCSLHILPLKTLLERCGTEPLCDVIRVTSKTQGHLYSV